MILAHRHNSRIKFSGNVERTDDRFNFVNRLSLAISPNRIGQNNWCDKYKYLRFAILYLHANIMTNGKYCQRCTHEYTRFVQSHLINRSVLWLKLYSFKYLPDIIAQSQIH